MHPHPENVDSQGVRIAGTKEIVDRKVANLYKIELFACINSIIWLAVPFIVASLAFSCGIRLLENLRLFVIPESPSVLPILQYNLLHATLLSDMDLVMTTIPISIKWLEMSIIVRESHKAAMLFMFTT